MLQLKVRIVLSDIPRHKTLTRSPVIYVTAKHTALYHNQDILYNTRPSYSPGGGALVNRTKQNKYDPLILTEREGITGQYGPEFVAVQIEHNGVGTKISLTKRQYSPVRLEQGVKRMIIVMAFGPSSFI